MSNMDFKVFVYTRFSPRPNAQECDSCERQLERCEAHCRARGYHSWSIFKDKDITGATIDRPRLQAILKAVRPGDVVVVDSVDRLSRDLLVALTVQHTIEKAGARIEYANGTPSATTPESRLFLNILAAFAAYERDRVKHATSRGIKKRQENGEWFGQPPVGWMRDPKDSKTLMPNDTEQCAVRMAKSLAGEIPSGDIAKALTVNFGYFRGRPWSARTVRKIISNQRGEE